MKSVVFASCIVILTVLGITATSLHQNSANAQDEATQKASSTEASLDFVDLQTRETKGPGTMLAWSTTQIRRSKIPGGWLVTARPSEISSFGESKAGAGITFVPDPEHRWDGTSLP